MLDSAKARLRKTKEVAHKYQLPIACTVSAVVATAITWRVSGDVMNHTFRNRTQLLLLREALLRDFVAAKGLKEEFLNDYLPSLTQ